MPSATKELQDEWVEDNLAVRFLEGRGFKLTSRWTWVEPEGHEATAEEWRAIDYLFQEWDFGGLDRIDHPDKYMADKAKP